MQPREAALKHYQSTDTALSADVATRAFQKERMQENDMWKEDRPPRLHLHSTPTPTPTHQPRSIILTETLQIPLPGIFSPPLFTYTPPHPSALSLITTFSGKPRRLADYVRPSSTHSLATVCCCSVELLTLCDSLSSPLHCKLLSSWSSGCFPVMLHPHCLAPVSSEHMLHK